MKKSATAVFDVLEDEDSVKGAKKVQEILDKQKEEQEKAQEQNEDEFHEHHELSACREMLGDLHIHLERLEMVARIGEGGFAVVDQAVLLEKDCKISEVAVKKLKPDFLASKEDLKEFLEEANLLRKLQCEYVVALRGLGFADVSSLHAMRESVYVVQEYMSGGTLFDLLVKSMSIGKKQEPLYTASDAVRWARQIVKAMMYLHNCYPAIIHRDLKSENILLTDGPMCSRVAKVADLGLHKRMGRFSNLNGSHKGREVFGSNYRPNMQMHVRSVHHGTEGRVTPGSTAGATYGGSTVGGTAMFTPAMSRGSRLFENTLGKQGAQSSGNLLKMGLMDVRGRMKMSKSTGQLLAGDHEWSGVRMHGGSQHWSDTQSTVDLGRSMSSVQLEAHRGLDLTQGGDGSGINSPGTDASGTSQDNPFIACAPRANERQGGPLATGANNNSFGRMDRLATWEDRQRSSSAPTHSPCFAELERSLSLEKAETAHGGQKAFSYIQQFKSERLSMDEQLNNVQRPELVSTPNSTGSDFESTVRVREQAGSVPGVFGSTGSPSGSDAVNASGAGRQGLLDAYADGSPKSQPSPNTLSSTPGSGDLPQSLLAINETLRAAGGGAFAGGDLGGGRSANNPLLCIPESASVAQESSAVAPDTNGQYGRILKVKVYSNDKSPLADNKGSEDGAQVANGVQEGAAGDSKGESIGLLAQQIHNVQLANGTKTLETQPAAASDDWQHQQAQQLAQYPSLTDTQADQRANGNVISNPMYESPPYDARTGDSNMATLSKPLLTRTSQSDAASSSNQSAANRPTSGQQQGEHTHSHRSAKSLAADSGENSAAAKAFRGTSKSVHGGTAGSVGLSRLQRMLAGSIHAGKRLGASAHKSIQSIKRSNNLIDGTTKVGSYLYMAPEVYRGQLYSEKIDVFSFSIVLYELLTMRPLVTKLSFASDVGVIDGYCQRVADGFREHIPTSWPEDLRFVVSSCWAMLPEDRPSFEEIDSMLEKVQNSAELQNFLVRPPEKYDPSCDCGCSIM